MAYEAVKLAFTKDMDASTLDQATYPSAVPHLMIYVNGVHCPGKVIRINTGQLKDYYFQATGDTNHVLRPNPKTAKTGTVYINHPSYIPSGMNKTVKDSLGSAYGSDPNYASIRARNFNIAADPRIVEYLEAGEVVI